MPSAVEPKRGPDAKLFGQVTVGVVAGIIFLAMLVQWGRLATRRRPRRLLAVSRFVSYTHVPILDMSAGHCIVMFSSVLILLVYLLSAEQYYRAGKWSPLGLRAGYIAIGLCPFIFTLGSRINPLAWMTHITHERLMVYHQWGARTIFLFSMIHTGTMLKSKWAKIGELWETEGAVSHFFSPDARLANGTVAIVMMAWIVFSSFANFRKLSYEFFVAQHVITVLLLLLSLIAHLQVDLKQGIKYLYASAAVWAFSVLIRTAQTAYALLVGKGDRGQATLVDSGDNVTRLQVSMSKWSTPRAGQHVYLRLLGIHILQTHPFTIVSTHHQPSGQCTIDLLVRSRNGITKHLADQAIVRSIDKPSIPVIIHGPFGHLEERLSGFDEVLLIAGGIGCTFVWPIAEELERQGRAWRMIWAVRTEGALSWIKSESIRVNHTNVSIHITGQKAQHAISFPQNADQGQGVEEDKDQYPSQPTTPRNGRPDVSSAIKELASTSGRKAVLVCGPVGLVGDVSAAAARIQYDILRGKSPASEIWLHREYFAW